MRKRLLVNSQRAAQRLAHKQTVSRVAYDQRCEQQEARTVK
jgi:hypothetical protein